jgi:hypothetical protein
MVGPIPELAVGLGARVIAKEDERPEAPEPPPDEEDRRVLEAREEARPVGSGEAREPAPPAEEREDFDRANQELKLSFDGRRARLDHFLDEAFQLGPARGVEPFGLRHDRRRDRAEGVADRRQDNAPSLVFVRPAMLR